MVVVAVSLGTCDLGCYHPRTTGTECGSFAGMGTYTFPVVTSGKVLTEIGHEGSGLQWEENNYKIYNNLKSN